MIITANKPVNTRLGFPHTTATNPTFLEPGHQLDVVQKVYGELLDGNNEWFLSREDEYYWSGGFHTTAATLSMPVKNMSDLFDEWRIADFWKQGITGAGVKVAVIDAGFNPGNIAIKHAINPDDIPSLQFPDTGHGTYMSAIICGNDVKEGYLGVAPGVQLHFAEIDTNDNSFNINDLISILHGLEGYDIVSMSFSFKGGNTGDTEIIRQFDEVTNKFIDNGNAIFVAATGNKADEMNPYYPAAYPLINAVAGSESDGSHLHGLSNIWQDVELIAPFRGYFNKATKSEFTNYFNTDKINGTSSATAFTAGLIALIKSAHSRQGKVFRNVDLTRFLEDVHVQTDSASFNLKKINKEQFFSLLK
ncbi:Subtilase family protein [Chitinophaga ginsengisegetis]|uniref:Subtilase family protein n=1 Tax=Chitinophaga ginsengisegetis TaxID=393003 RepID=A0A1T5NFG0_9BACT|nr:S8/S53 family peptidase [Chitinophaga ginsengisegetis]SKC99137.1 Subtilase family protein [Chitinophaga ginsengisegetis]